MRATSFRLALLTLTSALVAACQGADSDEPPPELASEPEVILYPSQPMVVDVVVELDRPGEVVIEHLEDPGVVATTLAREDEDRRHTVRVRGLAPATAHELELRLSAGEGEREASHPLSLTSELPLPGFRPSFEVETHIAEAVDGDYRLFDYTYTPLWVPAGVYAIDTAGVPRWYCGGDDSPLPGPTSLWSGLTLREDGSLLTTRDGAVVIVDELCVDQLELPASDFGYAHFHHDVIELPSGNFLALSNSFAEVDYQDLGTTLVAGDLLVELSPAGEVVWTWDAFDHLDPQRRRAVPEEGLPYVDPESGGVGYDWTHGNGMIHRAEDDLILLSMRHQDWMVAIDHQSGEVVWRLGPEGDFELLDGTWFYHPHSPEWQADGSLMLYDNAIGNPDLPLTELRSRAVRYELDEVAMTATQVWEDGGEKFVAPVAGDASHMRSDNVLVLDSSLQPDPSVFDVGQNFSRLRELDSEGNPVWTLTTKLGSMVYRAIPTSRLPGEPRTSEDG
jgi:hypothetical protein